MKCPRCLLDFDLSLINDFCNYDAVFEAELEHKNIFGFIERCQKGNLTMVKQMNNPRGTFLPPKTSYEFRSRCNCPIVQMYTTLRMNRFLIFFKKHHINQPFVNMDSDIYFLPALPHNINRAKTETYRCNGLKCV